MKTKTQKIFELNAPYNNPYQSNRPKIVFVCSVGMLRSPTACAIGFARGYNCRAVGSDTTCALIPLSANLIEWADHIVFVNKENYDEAVATFEAAGYKEDIDKKVSFMHIKDSYEAFDPTLVRLINAWFDEWESENKLD